jgi:valyl-tRNA synthetase
MGKRHGLEFITVLDEKGVVNENGGRFKGLDRNAARKAVVDAMEAEGLLEKIEDYTTSIGHCSRCKTVIEPYLSLQWFVRMKPLAEPALEAVRDGRIKFHPVRWEKVYYSWLENVRDWCISRQLWWGHRIPVWYCQACGEVIVVEEAPDACPKCRSTSLRQDEDVLDTWFSSWLWPFSTLGWPEKTRALDFWYPTNVLVSGYDIIFFWIARMIMAGIEFMGDVPYNDVFITGMIKDEQGRWMSKSLGNGIDPAEMVKQYGADAVRFTMITLATEGQDIKLSPSRFEGGRNFANKLWNAYRFLMGNAERFTTRTPRHEEDSESSRLDISPKDSGKLGVHFGTPNSELQTPNSLADRWIVSRLHATIEQVNIAADKYRLYECLSTLYDFLWKDYCDWYIELLKGRLSDETPEDEKRQALTTAISVFEAAMRLLHPGMPFITEEIWQGMRSAKCQVPSDKWKSIMVAEFPKADDYRSDPVAESELELFQKVITAVRTIRAEMRVPPERKAALVISGCSQAKRQVLEENLTDLKRIGLLTSVGFDSPRPAHSASMVVDDFELYVPLEGLIDLEVEKGRLDKEITRLEGVIRGAEAKLGSAAFTEKAPIQVVEHERQKLAECQAQLEAVKRNREVLE